MGWPENKLGHVEYCDYAADDDVYCLTCGATGKDLLTECPKNRPKIYTQADIDKAVRDTIQKIYGAIADDTELLMRVIKHLTDKAINELADLDITEDTP